MISATNVIEEKCEQKETLTAIIIRNELELYEIASGIEKRLNLHVGRLAGFLPEEGADDAALTRPQPDGCLREILNRQNDMRDALFRITTILARLEEL